MNKIYFLPLLYMIGIQGCSNERSHSAGLAEHSTRNQCIINHASDVPKQMPCLENNAKAGSAIDQYNLAIALRDGLNGQHNNPAEVFFWMKQAAEQGRSDAQLNLGVMYMEGLGVPADREQALFWLNQALANGRNEAYTNIGNVYEKMPPIDEKLAFQNHQQGANAGQQFAQANLGRCYLYGIGVEANHEKGISLLTEAADNGVPFAQDMLIQIHLDGKTLPQNKKKAFELSQKYADMGYATGLYNLGVMYEQGWGVEVNHTQSAEYFRKAAEKNQVSAQYNLALMLWEGKYIQQNEEEAIALFKTAAEHNCGKAMDSLTRIFLPTTEVHQFWKEQRKQLQKYQDVCADLNMPK